MNDEEMRAKIQARNAGYLARLAKGAPAIGYRCLCCRDSAMICGDVLARYNLVDPHPDHCDYDGFGPEAERGDKFLGAHGYLCRRPGCTANKIKGDEGGSTLDRFTYGVDDSISAAVCQWVHEQEAERLKASASQPRPTGIDFTALTAAIAKPMPAQQPLNPNPPRPTVAAAVHPQDDWEDF